ncbi:hypothetical protein HDU98_001605 [Podochytrium sp. JEL0797]|nr:hypothetical protein HDU98_001605 [Podochytrium sp. JEL0797]
MIAKRQYYYGNSYYFNPYWSFLIFSLILLLILVWWRRRRMQTMQASEQEIVPSQAGLGPWLPNGEPVNQSNVVYMQPLPTHQQQTVPIHQQQQPYYPADQLPQYQPYAPPQQFNQQILPPSHPFIVSNGPGFAAAAPTHTPSNQQQSSTNQTDPNFYKY